MRRGTIMRNVGRVDLDSLCWLHSESLPMARLGRLRNVDEESKLRERY